jgi:hypothetical protein
VFASLQRSRPFLVTFSGEAEKVTARRAGALQRGEAKLRPTYKQGSRAAGLQLHPSKSKTERRSKRRATEGGRPYGLLHKKCAPKAPTRTKSQKWIKLSLDFGTVL